MQKKDNLVIVGAGLIGSLLACLLAKRGFPVQLYDLRADPRKYGFLGGRSINLALSTRGWKALAKTGLQDDVRKVAIPMRGRMMHGIDGQLTFQPYGKKGQAIYSVSRANLNLVLLQQADKYPDIKLHFHEKCQAVDLQNRQLQFINIKNHQRSTVNADVIFGSDGAFSKVRGAMQQQNRFNYSQQYIAHGYKELSIPPTASGDFALEPHALHIWPRKSYMLIALPNPDKSFTVTLFFPYQGEHSFETVPDGRAAKAFFKQVFPDAVPLMPRLVEEYDENPASSLVTIRCSPWTTNRSLVIGDAAHAILPFFGQGMNAGFEDCDVFDDLLEQPWQNWEALFESFQQRRIVNANAIAELAYRNFAEMRDHVADPEFLLRKQIESHLQELFPDKWIPLYSMVTFSTLPYAEALERGKQQQRIMDRLMQLPEVRHSWQHFDFGQVPELAALQEFEMTF